MGLKITISKTVMLASANFAVECNQCCRWRPEPAPVRSLVFESPQSRSGGTFAAREIRRDTETERVLQTLRVEYAQIEAKTVEFWDN